VWPTILPFSGLDFPQVAEGRCGYAGSNKAVSVERDSVWKEQLLEPLPLFERCLHPQLGGARQNAFCERQDALYVEFIELAGVTVYPGERELLAQFLGVAVVRVDVDRPFEQERLVETVEFVLNRLCGSLRVRGPRVCRDLDYTCLHRRTTTARECCKFEDGISSPLAS
jgi:hypothetical protein